MGDTGQSENTRGRRDVFVTTQWTVLRDAANSQSPDFETALEQICTRYWYPLYAYVRRSGNEVERAKDLTQGFFEHLLSRGAFKQADPEVGRFRSFLLTSLKNYLHKEHRDANRLKRGGGAVHLPMEWDEVEGRYSNEPVENVSPEMLFDRNWAKAMVSSVIRQIGEEYERAGEADRFQALRSTLENPRSVKYAQIAEELGISEAGVKSAVRRLQKRFQILFRESILDLVDSPEDLEREIRHLLTALG